MAKQPRLTKNMEAVVARVEQGRKYRDSQQFEAMVERHMDWMWEQGIDEKKQARMLDRFFGGPPKTRVRRGKVVEIPEVWRGMVTHPQTMRKRKSKEGGKRTKMKKTH